MKDFIERIPSEIEDQSLEVTTYEINYYPADYTLQVLYDKWKSKEILIPSFQRGYVWTVSQASKLVESFLLGLPVPGVFFYRDRESQTLLVIDGQQRLRTIFSFFEGLLPFSQKKFYLRDINPKWGGKVFSDLNDSDKIKLKDSVLRATIVDQINPKDNSSIFHIFERLNTGGTILKPQEVRNCLYQGEFNDTLKELNNNEKWRQTLGSLLPDKRMRDIELILRFIALLYDGKNYKKPMKVFLSDFMKKYRNNSAKIGEFKNIFNNTILQINTKLGKSPFKLKAGINVAILDAVMIAFAIYLNKIPSNIEDRYNKLRKNEAFIDYISNHTTDDKIVKQRIALAIETLFK